MLNAKFAIAIFYSDIAALIEQRSDTGHALRGSIEFCGHGFHAAYLRRNHTELVQHLYQISRRATTEPIRIHLTIGKSVQQAERIVNVGRRLGKVIAVIVIFQFRNRFLTRDTYARSQQIQVIGHLCQHFFFADTADSSVCPIHADVLDIIQLAEDA